MLPSFSTLAFKEGQSRLKWVPPQNRQRPIASWRSFSSCEMGLWDVDGFFEEGRELGVINEVSSVRGCWGRNDDGVEDGGPFPWLELGLPEDLDLALASALARVKLT